MAPEYLCELVSIRKSTEKTQVIQEDIIAGVWVSDQVIVCLLWSSSNSMLVASFMTEKRLEKPHLTLAMKKKRLNFARRHRHWTLNEWKKVLFSDECT